MILAAMRLGGDVVPRVHADRAEDGAVGGVEGCGGRRLRRDRSRSAIGSVGHSTASERGAGDEVAGEGPARLGQAASLPWHGRASCACRRPHRSPSGLCDVPLQMQLLPAEHPPGRLRLNTPSPASTAQANRGMIWATGESRRTFLRRRHGRRSPARGSNRA